ncbi:ParA family protein, partial [Phocaeicola vulgatus]
FRSTIFPMDASLLKGSGIREFSEEISRIIKPQ